MAKKAVDTDLSGRPLSPVESLSREKPRGFRDLVLAHTRDGVEVADFAGGYYYLKRNRRPDFDRPVPPELMGIPR